MLKTLAVGGGNATQIRQEYGAYPDNVEIVGVVDTDPTCWYNTDYTESDAPFYLDLEESADRTDPDVIDITTPTNTHYSVAKEVMDQFTEADILLEKPVATPEEVDEIERLAEKHDGRKWVVDENYRASGVTETVREYAEELGLASGPVEISIDFTKNREKDVEDGRYLDRSLGVFGYEGPHMLTSVMGTEEERKPDEIVGDVQVDPMDVDRLDPENNQGTGAFTYRTEDGSNVNFHTSMIGEIGHRIPEFDTPERIGNGDETRWRVMEIRDPESDLSILGRYEPDHRKDERFIGEVAVRQDGQITEKQEVEDASMDQMLDQAFDYFENGGENPSPVGDAAEIVRFLNDRPIREAL